MSATDRALCVLAHDPPREAVKGYLCRSCFGRLERTVAELPAVHAWLEVHVARGSSAGGERVDTSREDPTPIRLSVPDQQQRIRDVLTEWTRLVCEETRLRGPSSRRVEALATWLVSQLDWCSRQPWVDEMAAEMAEVRRECQGIAPWSAGFDRIAEPCPTCHLKALSREYGSERVDCRHCGASWDGATWLAHLMAGERSA